MDKPFFESVLEPHGRLPNVIDRIGNWECPAFANQSQEVCPWNIFHYQIGKWAIQIRVVNLHDIFVIKSSSSLDFRHKTGTRTWKFQFGWGDSLQRHNAFHGDLAGLVNHTHT